MVMQYFFNFFFSLAMSGNLNHLEFGRITFFFLRSGKLVQENFMSMLQIPNFQCGIITVFSSDFFLKQHVCFGECFYVSTFFFYLFFFWNEICLIIAYEIPCEEWIAFSRADYILCY